MLGWAQVGLQVVIEIAKRGVGDQHDRRVVFSDGLGAKVFVFHRTLDAQFEGKPVLGERVHRIAMYVATELVDQDDQRQATFG